MTVSLSEARSDYIEYEVRSRRKGTQQYFLRSLSTECLQTELDKRANTKVAKLLKYFHMR